VVAQPQVVYSGVDPTAKYLHVGHLLPLLCLFHFQLRGHRAISLVRYIHCFCSHDADECPQIGGATGLVGDPSGRDTERPLSEASMVGNNADQLAAAIMRFFQGAISYAKKRLGPSAENIAPPAVMNNLEWFQGMGLLQFLRTVGINARVNSMLARERYGRRVFLAA
jgi:tyrosyl-tRNA synthetase